MSVYKKQGAWWIDWYEDRRRRRKKTAARTKTEAKQLLEKVKARMVPRELGLFDPKFSCAELVTRYLEAIKGIRAHETWRSAELSLRNFFTWCTVRQVAKLTPEITQRYAAHRRANKISIRTVHIELTVLKACLNWSVENDRDTIRALRLPADMETSSAGGISSESPEEPGAARQAYRATLATRGIEGPESSSTSMFLVSTST